MLAQRLVPFSFPWLPNAGQNKIFRRLDRGTSTIQKYALLFVLPFAPIPLLFAPTITRLLFGTAFVQGGVALQILTLGVNFSTYADQICRSQRHWQARVSHPGLHRRKTLHPGRQSTGNPVLANNRSCTRHEALSNHPHLVLARAEDSLETIDHTPSPSCISRTLGDNPLQGTARTHPLLKEKSDWVQAS